MSEFKIKSQNVRSLAQDLNNIARQMQGLEDQIRRIQNGLSFEIAQKERIRQRLRTAQNNTASHSRKIYSSTSTLQNVVNAYETTEQRLVGKRVPMAEMVKMTAMSEVNELAVITPASPGAILPPIGVVPPVAIGGLIGKLIDGSSPWNKHHERETKDKYGKYEYEFDDYKIDRDKTSFHSKNNEKEELKGSKIDPVKLWEKSWKDTHSVWHTGDMVGDKDGTHSTYNFDFLKRETSAEIYGGLYYTDPETGAKKLRMAAGVSLGFTMSAFSADAEMQLGNSNLGGYVKSEIEVGKVEVKGTGTIGLRDAQGNFNPTLHGKISAEAIGAEASVKGGVKVAGADVGVKASVNVGIGIHAEAGYKDGKFSLDIGASFGIGGSVKLEVDVSGTVKAVSGAAKSAWNTFTGWFK